MTTHPFILLARPALAAGGAALSLWMWRQSSGMRGLPGCGAGSGCDAVTHSRWARWCGVPVAMPAALLYLGVLGAFLVLSFSHPARVGDAARMLLGSAAPLLVFSAAWFTALQGLAVRRFCFYCLMLHAIGIGVAGLVLMDASRGARPDAAGWAVAACTAAALVLGQALVEPRMYQVVASGAASVVSGPLSVVKTGGKMSGGKRLDKPTAQRSGASDGSGTSGTRRTTETIRGSAALRRRLVPSRTGAPNSASLATSPTDHSPLATVRTDRSPLATARTNPFAERRVVSFSGRVSLEGGKWPVLGSPDARVTLVYLFDYTCANCRLLHGVLLEAMREDAERFAVMMVPVPRDPRCNPAISRPEPEHANACAYARLALAVWAADWRQYAAFDAFLFDGKEPSALGLARGRAGELLGRAVDDPRTPDPETDAVIREGIEVYRSVGPERTPTVLMPTKYFTGRVNSTKELWRILEQEDVKREDVRT